MYGPNAEAVLEILDRLEEITPAEARPIAESWLAIPKTDRELARKAVRKIYESDEEQNRHLQLAREAVGTWMAVTAGYPEYVNAEPDWARICAQTGEAALDATTALILEETLEEAHFEALFTPWSETTAQLDEAAEAAAAAEAGTIVTGEDEVTEDDEFEEGDEEAAFGPNSDAVADFLNRLWLITPEQVGRLVGGWQNAPRQELHQAHEALQSLVDEDPEYRYQVRAAQEKLAPWLNSGRIQETSSFLGQSGQGESRKMAGPALADAIAALVLGDLLEPVDAEVLYGPWFNLIGAPPLPEIGEEEAPKPKGKASTSTKAKIEPKSPAKPEATAKPKPVGKAKPAAAPKGGAKSKPAAKSTPAAKAKAKGKPKK
jgi:alkylhydroperoxidase family enzyme